MPQKIGEGAKEKDVKGDNPIAEKLGRIRKDMDTGISPCFEVFSSQATPPMHKGLLPEPT